MPKQPIVRIYLRFGFIEAASEWIPFALKDLRRRMPALKRTLPDLPLKE